MAGKFFGCLQLLSWRRYEDFGGCLPGVLTMRCASVYDLLLQHARERGGVRAMLAKQDGRYRPYTWQQLEEVASNISLGLLSLGVQAGDRVVLISQTRREWILCDFGIVGAGAVTVPIYPQNLSGECQYITEDSGAVLAVAEDAVQVDKLRKERSRLPLVRHVVQLTGEVPRDDDWVLSYDELLLRGREQAQTLGAELASRRQALGGESLLTIIYTSGTTGMPKGVVLTHANMLYEAQAAAQIDILRASDIQMLFLPLAHVFGRFLVITWLATRHTLAIAESVAALPENLRRVRPTVIASVPRIYEKLHTSIVQAALAHRGPRAVMFRAAMELSERAGEAELQRRPLPAAEAVAHRAFKRLVFKRVGRRLRQRLGGRMRVMISGGAPLSPKIGWFFRDAGLLILEGYGLTETSAPICVNRPNSNRIGTVGLPLPGTHMRIAGDGEVLVKGPNIMREYWREPDATREVLDEDGWLHTGDIGTIDGGGFLRITDRKKDIIVTAGGKSIAPQNLENMFKADPLISQVVVHGDRRKFLSALITLDPENLKRFAEEHDLGNGSYADLVRRPEVQKVVEAKIAAFNEQLPHYETIKRYKVLEHEFSVESGELTPSLKVKRRVVGERYRQLFDSFYEEQF